MWQCKECGKKYNAEPIYCDFCGASENFIEPVNASENESFYEGVEKSYQTNICNKNFDDYDQLIKDFLSDEYQPISRKIKEPFEDEMLEKAKKERREERLKSIDNEYYESIKTVVGTDSIEMDEYYRDLEDLFKEPIQSGDQTTFNGIFRKEDTIENTFLKPKDRKGRSIQKANETLAKPKKKINIPVPSFNFDKKENNDFNNNPKVDKKLFKILGALCGVFVSLVILMVFVVGNIVGSGDESGKLPSKNLMIGFFSSISKLGEQDFIDNPSMISFMEYNGTNTEKQDMLKQLYTMVKSGKMKITGVSKIEQKGINRVLVTYNVEGDSLYVQTFDKLLFRTSDNKTYQLDFTDFVTQYTKVKEKLN